MREESWYCPYKWGLGHECGLQAGHPGDHECEGTDEYDGEAYTCCVRSPGHPSLYLAPEGETVAT